MFIKPSIPLSAQDEANFWLRVAKFPGGCWEWLDQLDAKGYGFFNFARERRLAHRVSWQLINGPVPTGAVIDHICHTPSCVRPDHLRAISQKQNQEHRSPLARTRSGHRGVSWVSASSKWRVAVKHNGVYHHGGLFVALDEAVTAAKVLRNKLYTHNDFDRV